MKPGERISQGMKGTAKALGKEMAGTGGEHATAQLIDPSAVEPVIAQWPSIPQQAARRMIARYGLPQEATPSRLIWFGNGPWKRTIVYRDEVPHNFPKPHTDVLEQFIDYRIPPDRADDVMSFDGSVIPERTKGEVSARCDMEEMNFLALNLMHDIVTGKRSVDEARKAYADTASAFMMNRPAPYAQRLLFEPPRGNTADLDEVMIAGAMAHQMSEKIKDVVKGPERKN
jgi:hypothetical protein